MSAIEEAAPSATPGVPATRLELPSYDLLVEALRDVDVRGFILSRDGQERVRYSGYFPLTAAEASAELAKLGSPSSPR